MARTGDDQQHTADDSDGQEITTELQAYQRVIKMHIGGWPGQSARFTDPKAVIALAEAMLDQAAELELLQMEDEADRDEIAGWGDAGSPSAAAVAAIGAHLDQASGRQ